MAENTAVSQARPASTTSAPIARSFRTPEESVTRLSTKIKVVGDDAIAVFTEAASRMAGASEAAVSVSEPVGELGWSVESEGAAAPWTGWSPSTAVASPAAFVSVVGTVSVAVEEDAGACSAATSLETTASGEALTSSVVER